MKQSETNDELLTPEDVAKILCLSKRTVLERYAIRPDFPGRIAISKRKFWWKRSEVMIWLERNKEKRAAT
ncbi:helix-turn-helix transcriptional regulator [Kingella oralis]|uniref:helix-turn-helix transcriptional regulator n=1 Tax=Kingella oralis TaxID=505 RepID=UPI0034E4E257